MNTSEPLASERQETDGGLSGAAVDAAGHVSASYEFDRVVAIFNPNSTGDAPDLARELEHDLHERLPGLDVVLQPTERAGHARDLARDAAREGRPLIVSVSGDGGYNEVVNGVVDAGNPRAVCTVLGAGNANDHARDTQHRPLVDAIAAGTVVPMDLLRLTITGAASDDPSGAGSDLTRYAHSYIGVGLTPVVAIELEKGGKGSIRELAHFVRTFSRFRPFWIELSTGERVRVDSLLFANISQMAKVAKLSDNGDPRDGRFEVVTIPHSPKWRVLATALRAATRGLGDQPTAEEYTFTAIKPMPLQIDGEILRVSRGDVIRVDIAAAAITTVT